MKDKPVTEQSERDLVFSLYYYICLVALGGVVVWHWILGGKYGIFGMAALYSLCAFIVLGFLNAIGLFGRR